MRQADMELLLAKGEYEVRSYFLCGSSARINNVDGTTMIVTNKRIVLEFMNHCEVSRREIPINQILFVRSHYYEEHEDPTFANRCKKIAATLFTLAALFLVAGVLAIAKVFSFLATMPWIGFIPMAIALVFIIIASLQINKAKQFKPRVGKKLELLIGTTLDFEQGLGFSTDSTRVLRDNMRTYGGTQFNSLVGSVELNPTKEAKRMVNEIGALLIDIKAGLFDEDPEIRAKRERAIKEKKRLEEERKRQEGLNKDQQKKDPKIKKEEKKPQETRQKQDGFNPAQDRKDRMAKYGAPLEEDEYSKLPAGQQAAFRKSKMPIPTKTGRKSEDELLEEEYQAVLKSLELD